MCRALLLMFSLCAAGCAATRPCDPQLAPPALAEQPPRSCRVDGCSLAPDFDFTHCCDRHDSRYWPGGSRVQRSQADRAFRQCIEAANHPLLGGIYYYGVRIGGTPYLPTPWRWGFGWDYPRGYRDIAGETASPQQAEAGETTAR